jgi:hypothetical protein
MSSQYHLMRPVILSSDDDSALGPGRLGDDRIQVHHLARPGPRGAPVFIPPFLEPAQLPEAETDAEGGNEKADD